jgi:hypothetical protein
MKVCVHLNARPELTGQILSTRSGDDSETEKSSRFGFSRWSSAVAIHTSSATFIEANRFAFFIFNPPGHCA